MSERRPLYAVLGVDADASTEVIKLAYRRLALQHHPDKRRAVGVNDGDDVDGAFARVAFAYEILSNMQRRKRYDLTGEVPQADSAVGRKPGETFLAEYVRAAPKAPRAVTQRDMSLHSIDNYEVLELDSRDVPEYMRSIVMIGLNYLVATVEGMEEKEVVLLRHFVMDQMYALLAYIPPLDDDAFTIHGYIITYYDHPLQEGIQPFWSDQNISPGGANGGGKSSNLRVIDSQTMERRRLAALEWSGPMVDASGVAKCEPPPDIPGSGHGRERLYLAAVALVRRDHDVGSFTSERMRRELERILRLEPETLNGVSGIASIFLEAMEEVGAEDEELGGTCQGIAVAALAGDLTNPPSQPPTVLAVDTSLPTVGSTVRVVDTGRIGEVIRHDPDDPAMTYKVKFDDGAKPECDWFAQHAVS